MTSGESGAIEARRRPRRRGKSRGEFFGAAGTENLGRIGVDRPPPPEKSAGEGGPPRAFRLTARRHETIDGRKRRTAAETTLLRSSAPLFATLDASIAVPTGDGHPERRVPSHLLPTQHGGIPRSPSAKRPKRRRRLSFAVLDRRLSGSSRPSPSLRAMDTRGGGCPLAFSHRSTGRFADHRAPSGRNDRGHSPPSFWIVFWVVACVHRRPDRRWTPGEAGLPLRLFAAQHGGIRGSLPKKRPKLFRRLSWVVLYRF